jgi:hypothetical protein
MRVDGQRLLFGLREGRGLAERPTSRQCTGDRDQPNGNEYHNPQTLPAHRYIPEWDKN